MINNKLSSGKYIVWKYQKPVSYEKLIEEIQKQTDVPEQQVHEVLQVFEDMIEYILKNGYSIKLNKGTTIFHSIIKTSKGFLKAIFLNIKKTKPKELFTEFIDMEADKYFSNYEKNQNKKRRKKS